MSYRSYEFLCSVNDYPIKKSTNIFYINMNYYARDTWQP